MSDVIMSETGLLEEQARLLDAMASGVAPSEVLRELAVGMERFLAGGRCSILLYDQLSATLHEPCDQWVWADQRRLRQALLNVVGNAIRYNRAGGHVRVSAVSSARPRFVEVAVIDDGNGIPVSLRDRLFTPFARHDDGSNDAEGSGLGLAVSRQLVASMSGELTVSDNDTRGTTVRIVLPAAPAGDPSRYRDA